MVTLAATLAILLTAPQDQRIEYKFKSSLARFVNKQWKDLAKHQMPDVQTVDSPAGLPTGTWIYFDLKNNKAIIGSRGDTAEFLLDYLKQFDVQPKSVRLMVKLEQPDRGFEMKSTLETLNNQSTTLGSPDIEGLFTFNPRANADGTITVRVTLKRLNRQSEIVLRVKKGQPETIIGPVPGTSFPAPNELWSPYRIEVRAELIPPKEKPSPR